MQKLNTLILFILILSACKTSVEEKEISNSTTYEESWESLKQHNEAPEWFQDAKLGIYFHWGVYSVPAYGDEWYSRWMHLEGRNEYKHHLEKYGHPSEFGYHDFVPMFTAEKFNADDWVDLFIRAGARFAGPVAEHHDGFAMWDSNITPWNAADKGPKRDITGELKESLDRHELKLITTFHHAKNLQRHDSIPKNKNGESYRNSHYPFIKNMPPSSEDSELKYLYGNIPEEEWIEKIWLGKVKEVINKYQPDIIWFDSWLDQIPEEYRIRMAAYYLNEAKNWNKEVVIVRKQDDLSLDFSIDDLEKSRKNILEAKPWMTDETISNGSWSYTDDLKIKDPKEILHILIDIVSKNGVLLLNISPKADGSIPEDQRSVLLRIGKWLDTYGESIYNTRPWLTFGEGPTKEPTGHYNNHKAFLKIKYTGKDIRYTKSENVIYASVLGYPDAQSINLEAFNNKALPASLIIKNVELMGSAEKIDWDLTSEGLSLSVPSSAPDDLSVVYKISIE